MLIMGLVYTCVHFCAVYFWSDNVKIILALFNNRIASLFNVLEQLTGFYLSFISNFEIPVKLTLVLLLDNSLSTFSFSFWYGSLYSGDLHLPEY